MYRPIKEGVPMDSQFQIVVKVKGAKEGDIYSPSMSKEEAQSDLTKIRGTLGTVRRAEVDWMAAQGSNILSAHLIEVAMPSFA